MHKKRLQLLISDVNGGAEKVAHQIIQANEETENYLFFVKEKKLVVVNLEERTEFGFVSGLLKILFTKFNVVISHFYFTHLLLCFMSIFVFRESKKIFLIHSGYYLNTFSKFEQNLIAFLRIIFSRFQKGDIVYTSKFAQSSHIEIGWPSGRVLHNISIIPKEVVLNCKKLITSNNPKVKIGFVGRDHPDKGIDFLLEIIKAYQNSQSVEFFSIITSPKTNYSNLNLSNSDFGTETSNIYQYLGKIDILLVPSINESYPMIILEALNVGCTVVAASVGGIPEITSDRLHLIKERNLSVWVKKIDSLRKNGLPNRYSSASSNFRENAIDDYLERLECENEK